MDLREAFLMLENEESLTKIKYKNGLRAELPNGLILYVQKHNYKYRASILDGTYTHCSPEYNKKESLNNWMKKYNIELIFNKEK